MFRRLWYTATAVSDSAEIIQANPPQRKRLFYQRWAILLLIVAVAAFFRFYQLGQAPPGLYRDEAYNGLDAVAVLAGNRPIFFEANNGREPLFIYLIAASIEFFGRSALAIRLPAAIVGTLATFTTYALTKSWFDKRTALIAAALWAITLWPVHLSRVGFRTILLPFTFSLALYLLTYAYRRQNAGAYLVAGLVYGVTHYTYLASRLTPLVLAALLGYCWIVHRKRLRASHLIAFVTATATTLVPLIAYIVQNPNSAIGRTGQVSILSPIVNQGDPIGALLDSIGSTAGMFFLQGDTIVRHNPFGRAVFDWIIAIPFVIGVLWCIWRWRKPTAAATLITTTIMLIGTIFAEDAPHFLRSAGVLPVLLIFPSVGLSQLLSWSKLPRSLQTGLILLILIGSGSITFNDYFIEYAQQPDTYHLFEAAVREMAIEVIEDQTDTDTYVDQRFYEGWSSVPYLLNATQNVTPFQSQHGLNSPQAPAAIYAWPYESVAYINDAIVSPMHVTITEGSQIRGDLETDPRTLFVRYGLQASQPQQPIANFNQRYFLYEAAVATTSTTQLAIELTWGANQPPASPYAAFVHIISEDGTLIGQQDAPPGSVSWSADWWQPNVFVQEQRNISLSQPYNADKHTIHIGIYDTASQQREPLLDGSNNPINDHWQFQR